MSGLDWGRVDTDYFFNKKIAQLSGDAQRLDLAGILFSVRELREGTLTNRDVRVLAVQLDVELSATTAELSDAGRWIRTGDAWLIHDYGKYQTSREEIEETRAKNAERQRRWREARRNGVTNGVTNGVSNGRRTVQNSTEELIDRSDTPGEVQEGANTAAAAPPVPPPPKPRIRKEIPKTKDPGEPDPVDEIYAQFKERIQPRARLCPRKKIQARLDKFTKDEIIEAIEHFARDEWWMEHNASQGADWLFESDHRIEQLLLLEPRARNGVTNSAPRNAITPLRPSDAPEPRVAISAPCPECHKTISADGYGHAQERTPGFEPGNGKNANTPCALWGKPPSATWVVQTVAAAS